MNKDRYFEVKSNASRQTIEDIIQSENHEELKNKLYRTASWQAAMYELTNINPCYFI